jgi:hypothetical protein
MCEHTKGKHIAPIRPIDEDTLFAIMKSVLVWCQECVMFGGAHFKDVIFKK